MSDDDLRRLEREFREGGGVDAHARWIAARSVADCWEKGSACGSRPSATMLRTLIGQWN